jgi:hypothetical protein
VWRILCLSSFGTIIVVGIIGNVLQAVMPERTLPVVRVAFMAVMVAAFVTLVVSVPPVFVQLFILGQERIGNGDHQIVRFLREHERQIVYALWTVMAIGSAMAVPVAIRDWIKNP